MPPIRRILAALLLALVGAADPARAESMTREARLGDEAEATVRDADVHTWRIALVAGTTFRVRVRAHEDEGPALALTLRGPDDAVLGTDAGTDVRVEGTAAATGVFRADVRSAGGGEAEYRIDFEGESPSGGGGGTTTGGTVRLDAPRGATVRVEVRRRSGASPEVTAVRDATGRGLAFRVARASRSRIRLAPVPVSGPGGLDVDVRGRDGASGTYEVRFRVLDEDDDPPGSHDAERAPRRIVLALAAGADPQVVLQQIRATYPDAEIDDVRDGFVVIDTGREGTEFEDAADLDDRFPEILSAEPDAYVGAPEGTQSQKVILGSELGRTSVAEQPGMDQVRAAAAQARATGTGIVVAVLDTGADPAHEFLAGRLVAGRDFVGDGVTAPDDDPSEEANGADDDADGEIDEGFGHGTFVAGLVLAIAPDARVMPVRVLDTDARGTVSSIAAGIEWAVQNGADVINLSLGMDARSGVLADAVRWATGNGVVVVVATGNSGLPAAVSFPASVAGVVAVTATDPATRGPADFANGGPAATVAAPGASVVGPYPGDRYGTWSGTSFSAAVASGGAALLAEARPALAPAQTVARFRTSALPPPRTLTRAQRRRLGGGRLDLARLLR